MKAKAIVCMFGIFSVFLVTGCENTVQGFGKDMQKMGEKIQKSDNTPHNSQNQNAGGGS